ncbi:RGCVC family protein [Amycolatopsis anabasis]|uniref:RGCVC family protein n=1 Tax=Amycolatopsis anabasis TaxID=1840409 RepID=UPI001FEC62C8|nr:RGCVC family protein [Amycolatopsis anabasis]
MTVTESAARTVRDTAPPVPGTQSNFDGASNAVCAACPHPWSGHDLIAARYCAATVAGGHSRGCVCTGHDSQ